MSAYWVLVTDRLPADEKRRPVATSHGAIDYASYDQRSRKWRVTSRVVHGVKWWLDGLQHPHKEKGAAGKNASDPRVHTHERDEPYRPISQGATPSIATSPKRSE